MFGIVSLKDIKGGAEAPPQYYQSILLVDPPEDVGESNPR